MKEIVILILVVCLFVPVMLGEETPPGEKNVEGQTPEVSAPKEEIMFEGDRHFKLRILFLEIANLNERLAKLRAQQSMINQALVLSQQEFDRKESERQAAIAKIARENDIPSSLIGQYAFDPDFKRMFLVPKEE